MANKRKPKKRKPTKKRKIVRYTSPRDIPFSKYRIEWVDCVSDSNWADEKEFHKMKLARPVNVGWLFSKVDMHSKCLHLMTEKRTVHLPLVIVP